MHRWSPRYREVLHWLEAGPGLDADPHAPPLVLLHGLLAHGMAFRKVIAPLARHHRVIVPDLPGHGRDHTFRSPDLPPTVDALVDWLRALCDALAAPRIELVGHSIGALTAFLAARDPARFPELARVTLVSPGLQIGVPSWAGGLFARLPMPLARLGVTPLGLRVYEPIQWRRARMTRQEVRDYLAPLRRPERLRFLVDLGVDLVRTPDRLCGAEDIRAPLLVMWGERDHLLPVAGGHQLCRAARDARLAVMRGVGHCPMEDAPQVFVHLLRRFLAG